MLFGVADAQVTIFSENMGAPSGTTSIATNVFQNSGTQTYSGTADVRITTVSTGYTGASGGGNVFFTDTSLPRTFEISGINTTGYSSLTLSFGHYKSSPTANNQLVVEVSADGSSYFPLSYTRPTGTGTASWLLITATGPIPSTSNLRIRFSQAALTNGQFRIDDVTLTGTLAGFISVANTAWDLPSTWNMNAVPTAADNVTVNTNVTSANAITRNAGTTTTITTAGTLTMTNAYVNNGTTTVDGSFQTGTTGGVSINAGSTFLVNGTLQINNNGFIQTGSPIYGNASTLIYNTGGTFGRGLEWSHNGIGTIGTTPGYPNNVWLSNTTTFNYNNGTPLAKAINGNLSIQNGSAFYMDYVGGASGGPLTVGGNIVVNGTGAIVLGNANGDDLHLGGDLTLSNTSSFNGNNRAVYFIKTSGTQTITAPAGITIPYMVFSSTGSRTVTLANTSTVLNVPAPAGGNAIAFGSASDVLELNNKTLNIGTAGVANVISGAGFIKGTTNATLSLLGTGSVGTLNFLTGAQVLGTFTMNRQAATVGATLGTPLTVNTTLNLTNGLIDVAAQTMTMGSGITINGAGANSYVVASVLSGGYLRKNVTTATTHAFPLGDSPASLNGAQYSPATIAFTTAPSGFISMAVEDDKHPNLDASTHYITRYWATAKTGTIPASYTFTGTYLPVDIVGTEGASHSNQWNGTSWTNQGMPVAANTLSITTTSFGATNHFTAGWRNADINIYQGTAATNVGSVSYTFPTTVLVGNTASVTFTIQNLGQQTLNMGAATFSGAPFSTTYAAGNISGPNGTTTFTVTFTPTATGTFSGTLSIPSNDPDESPYIVNFTAAGQVPAPEMNVRANSGGGNNIVDGSMTPDSLNNTLWGNFTIGSSGTKDFKIENVGSATLNLTGTPVVTIGGANPGDFTVTTQPASASLTAGGATTFIITFSPQAQGVRTAIVSIANNDSNENPYDFMIQGTGDCNATANTVTPLSGPEGTEVTITATANNLVGATATFNGVAAVVTQVSSTQIKVIVPDGATTGYLTTTNAQGCTASTYFTVIDFAVGSCQGSVGTPRTQLFISEVTDHPSGSHSYVEIFNATGATVNLAGYQVRIHNNGAVAATSTITLPSFNLLNGNAYVVAFGGSDATSNPGGATPNFTSSVSGINDNDNVRLYNPGGTWLDLWGDTSGSVFTPAPSGYFYRRKNTGITAPSTTWNPADWTFGAPVNYTNIGTYDFSVGALPFITTQPAYAPTCASTSFSVAATEGFVGGNALAYQWYFAAPGSTAWTAVPNSGVYSGATSATLNISNVSGLTGYQYYAQVRENGTTCYSASNAVMVTGAATSTWNGTAWAPAPPTSGTIAVIAGNYNTASHGSFEACNLTVNGGFSLTIAGNTYVSVQNNLVVNSTGTLLILDDGSLVQVEDSGTVTNNGTMQVMRTTSPYNKFDYTYWSSPVAAAAIGTTFAGWRTDYAFQFVTANYADLVAPFDGFDDNNNAWVYTPPATVMTKGKGYAIMAPTTGTFPATSTVTFSGAVNNGVITVPLALSGNTTLANDDFNLVGNPYPSALSADAFITANPSFAGTLYFWTHRTGISNTNPGPDANNFITADYAMYNMTGGTSSSGTGSPVPNGFVASGQGFFIDANTATSVVFNNSMRSRFYDNSQFFRPSGMLEAGQDRDRIWLSLQHANVLYSQQLIGFFDSATAGFDQGYDGVVNPAGNSVSFYSLMESDKYRIQGRQPFDVTDVIPLGYTTTATGSFTVSIDMVEGLLSQAGLPVYLEDKALGTLHDLKSGAYEFTSQPGTFDERFVLRFVDAALGNPDIDAPANGFAAYAQAGTVHVKSSQQVKRVRIYDLRGRLLHGSPVLSSETYQIELQASTQPLIITAELTNGELVTRKILF